MLTGSVNRREVKEGKANGLVAMVFIVSSWTGLRSVSGLILVLVLVGPSPPQTLVLFCPSARCSSSACQLLCSVATSHHSGSPEGPTGSLEGSLAGSSEGSAQGSSQSSSEGSPADSSEGSSEGSSADSLADSSEGSSAAISEAWLWF